MKEKPPSEESWATLPRTEMFNKVIVALGCARGEAETAGDRYYARYLWDEGDSRKSA